MNNSLVNRLKTVLSQSGGIHATTPSLKVKTQKHTALYSQVLRAWYRSNATRLLNNNHEDNSAVFNIQHKAIQELESDANNLTPLKHQRFGNTANRVGVELEKIDLGYQKIFVTGRYLTKPENTSAVYRVPFIHIWQLDKSDRIISLSQYTESWMTSSVRKRMRDKQTTGIQLKDNYASPRYTLH